MSTADDETASLALLIAEIRALQHQTMELRMAVMERAARGGSLVNFWGLVVVVLLFTLCIDAWQTRWESHGLRPCEGAALAGSATSMPRPPSP